MVLFIYIYIYPPLILFVDLGEDVVDGVEEEEDPELPQCQYVIIDSHDKLKLNLTPTAMDLIMELAQVRYQIL